MEIYKTFRRGVTWNIIEALCIPGLLALNQILLFKTLRPVEYGIVAVLFSLIYIALPIINFGFDTALPIFIKKYIESKNNFISILLYQLGIQSILVIFLSCLISFLYWFIGPYFFKVPTIPISMTIIIGLNIITESGKKTLRSLTHALFLNKATMLIELLSVSSYLIMVWGLFLYFKKLSLPFIFVPLLGQSLIAITLLILILRKSYHQLPLASKKTNSSQKLISKVNTLRGSIYLQQISLIFFSRNFLIPFLSWIFGFAAIGIFKLVSELAIVVLVFIEKVFGTTGSALLSHIKYESLTSKRKAFTMLSNYLFTLLLSIFIFLLFNGKTVFCLYCGTIASSYQALLFFFVIVFENIFIVYERFGIIEEKLTLIMGINFLSALFCFPVILLLQSSLPLSIAIIIATRIFAFSILSSLYYSYWKVPEKISLNWFFISGITIISIILHTLYSV